MSRRRVDVKLLFASLGIAVGIVLVIVGINSSVTGREQQRLPEAIEEVDPIRGATQVLQQSRVVVDLQAGYSAVLVLGGVELETVSLAEVGGNSSVPLQGGQVEIPKVAILEPGNNTLSYTPVEGGPIEEFSTGLNTATVVYWKTIEGRGQARTYTWTFSVV